LAKAKATGQDKNHPKRFKTRKEPESAGPLSKPPAWMKDAAQLEAWRTFAAELPWLNVSHRALVGIASKIRGQQMAGEDVSTNSYNLLRLCLGQMGATPVDSTKVTMPDADDDKDDDPSKKYF
jgi:hypothetical protein